MEIEFQNDYTVNTCKYTTPAFIMGKPLEENPCVCVCYNGCQYMKNIFGVPYPNYLKVSVSSEGGILRFINTSKGSKNFNNRFCYYYANIFIQLFSL
jgi:hypothetical protein